MSLLKQPYTIIDCVYDEFNNLYGEKTQMQIDRYQKTFLAFKENFNCDRAYLASSSGRVEVCGNHTDHNGGKVVSCAISLDTLAFFLPTNDNVITIISEGYGKIIVDLNKNAIPKIGTTLALVKGVCEGVKNKGYKVGGFNAYITSNVKGGAGISSSASFEVLICEILNFLYNDSKITSQENAIISQYSENVFFGKPCGLLDQTAIAFGGLKKLDFSNKDYIQVDDLGVNLSNFTLVLINTGGSHADLTDEYAAIPFEMKSVAKYFGKDRLIDVDENEFNDRLKELNGVVSDRAILRAIHFYEENARVDALDIACKNNDYVAFLEVIKQSGISSLTKLQNCYVSGKTEQLIPKALAISSKYLLIGANRVHGGGFAGTILNVIDNRFADNFINKMIEYFGEENVLPLKVRSKGVCIL